MSDIFNNIERKLTIVSSSDLKKCEFLFDCCEKQVKWKFPFGGLGYINIWSYEPQLHPPFIYKRFMASETKKICDYVIDNIQDGTFTAMMLLGLDKFSNTLESIKTYELIGASLDMDQYRQFPYSNCCILGRKGDSVGCAQLSITANELTCPTLSSSNFIRVTKRTQHPFLSLREKQTQLSLHIHDKGEEFYRNDKQLPVSLQNGINVLTFDSDLNLLLWVLFDTCRENPKISSNLVDYIKTLGPACQYLLLVSKGDARAFLSKEAQLLLMPDCPQFKKYLSNQQFNKWFCVYNQVEHTVIHEYCSRPDYPLNFIFSPLGLEKRHRKISPFTHTKVPCGSSNERNLSFINVYHSKPILPEYSGFQIQVLNRLPYSEPVFFNCTDYSLKEMARMILNDIPVDTLVVVVSSQLNRAEFPKDLLFALYSLGSQRCYQISRNSCFILLGRKGSRAGSVPEFLSTEGHSLAVYYEIPSTHNIKSFVDLDVIALSKKNHGYVRIQIDHKDLLKKSSPGINYAEINTKFLRVISRDLFYISSERLANTLEAVSKGNIVIMGIYDNSLPLTTRCVDVIKNQLGSKLIKTMTMENSLCFIGKKVEKGSSPDLAIECLGKIYSDHSMVSTMRIQSLNGDSTSTVKDIIVYSSKDKSYIKIDKQLIGSESQYKNGINIVTITNSDGKIGNLENYQLSNTEHINLFHNRILELKEKDIVIVTSQGSIGITPKQNDTLKHSFTMIGACRHLLLESSSCYCIIGRRNSRCALALERYTYNHNPICINSKEMIEQ
ncbi:hypothetical protein DLAC_09019 [Tieghemostelium lacteum]|uniref:ILEI/PANDER domain-containing protein n=1 Tax=Tieghemostelium lacteum TaxID=361077 RepID=A0A151Z8Y2_TIELA|nr:hypothetical protein DLAC_09019 [Tieghemostelium lacteum]|eukprot:KYQ90401.1 hypothetical protein DLAC_09019 [Tieghemostelium lacteum]